MLCKAFVGQSCPEGGAAQKTAVAAQAAARSGKDQDETLSESGVEAREPNEDSHLRLGRAFLADSEVWEGLGANPLVFVGLSAILPLLHT